MRLNKYLAASGISSRRKSEAIVLARRVKVNGVPIENPFLEVGSDDVVSVDGRIISPSIETVVIVLNKPRGYLTTVTDDRGRKTVLDLVRFRDRLFPIGRLDRETSGVLLLTNNGDLAHELSHPRFGVKKTYRVTIDRPLTRTAIQNISSGVDIGKGEKGSARVLGQEIATSRGGKGTAVAVRMELTHGKNREVRRIISALGYQVVDLERESFAGVRDDGLAPGQWRRLRDREVEKLMREEAP
ncbi:MAG: pseudouridine synthase [Fidelibacterota bacterium]